LAHSILDDEVQHFNGWCSQSFGSGEELGVRLTLSCPGPSLTDSPPWGVSTSSVNEIMPKVDQAALRQ